MDMDKAMLTCEQLSIGYSKKSLLNVDDTRILVKDLNVSIHAGQMVCLLGVNGVGKSTLMRVLAGQQQPLSGKVKMNDVDVHAMTSMARAQKIAIVYTGRMDPGFMRVKELLQLGRYPYTGFWGHLGLTDLEQVDKICTELELLPYMNRYFNELSDGEAQRVQVGRALVQNPSVLILDEPTAFLDPVQKENVMRNLQKTTHQNQCVTVVSTHDLDLALRYADQFLLLGTDSWELIDKENLQKSGKLTDFFAGCDLSHLKSFYF